VAVKVKEAVDSSGKLLYMVQGWDISTKKRISDIWSRKLGPGICANLQ
jgi:hypothetical protein